MPRKQPVWFVLIIRMTASSFTLIVVWIICSPYRNIGRGFNFKRTCLDGATQAGMVATTGITGLPFALRYSRPPCHWRHASFASDHSYRDRSRLQFKSARY